jgi:AraC-like DNA-binding protein
MSSRDVASALEYPSVKAFRRAFVSALGDKPINWAVQQNRETLAHKRVREAEGLLLSTDLTMKDVAASVGFAHQAHMSNAFKKVHGITPTEWKAKQRPRS